MKKNKFCRIFDMFALKFLAVFLIKKNKKCTLMLIFLLKLSHCNNDQLKVEVILYIFIYRGTVWVALIECQNFKSNLEIAQAFCHFKEPLCSYEYCLQKQGSKCSSKQRFFELTDRNATLLSESTIHFLLVSCNINQSANAKCSCTYLSLAEGKKKGLILSYLIELCQQYSASKL